MNTKFIFQIHFLVFAFFNTVSFLFEVSAMYLLCS